MGQIIDITGRITNELPIVRITEELTVTVNNRKNTILNVRAMVLEMQKKAQTDSGYNETTLMSKVIEMLTGKKSADEIEKLDLPYPEYKIVYDALMAAATGESLEDVEARFQ